MNSVFYVKLAWTNLVNNRRTYLPYSYACVCSIAMFYIMHAISINIGINDTVGSVQIQMILELGTIVIGIFSFIFLLYANSFLMKRRKKEVGLYNILGMEKKHIAKMLFFETLFVSLSCILVGLICGIIFSKLLFLLLLKILSFNVPFVFTISLLSLEITVILFLCVFLLTLLTNLMHIRLAKPIELLNGGQVGEKEPKTKWVMTILGILSLGSGYGIALTVKSPLLAIPLFFIAVLLVMFGTYALFTAGCIALLKWCRNNKKFYYHSNHFTSISGMIYRMKQNAVGLASICILSTAVLVTLSTTVSLYIGMDDALKTRFPKDVMIQHDDASQEYSSRIDQIIDNQRKGSQVKISEELSYHYLTLMSIREADNFKLVDKSAYSTNKLSFLRILTVDEYNRMENKAVDLDSDEVLIYSIGDTYGQKDICINNLSYEVKDEVYEIQSEDKTSVIFFDAYYIIVKDIETIRTIYKSAFDKELGNLDYFVGFNVSGEETDVYKLVETLNKEFKNQMTSPPLVECRQLSKASFLRLYGGLLFLGIFMGALFLMATALIIYYKQISEGYDDQERFAIMQKVGMSHEEVKNTIRSQIIMVFFLPLLMAVLHIAVAFKMITKLLAILNLMNIPLFFGCTVVTILIFAMIYLTVYALTARTYYKIIRR